MTEQNSRTRATAKYQKKVGLISKSYKLKKDVVDRFAEACAAAGISQSAQVTKMMEEYIEQSALTSQEKMVSEDILSD